MPESVIRTCSHRATPHKDCAALPEMLEQSMEKTEQIFEIYHAEAEHFCKNIRFIIVKTKKY